MSQITRCPACATMFKVVADQLKVAQGWVRCGQCGEVFEASLHLVAGGTGEAVASPSALRGLADEAALPPEPNEAPAGLPLPGEKTAVPPHPANSETVAFSAGSEERHEPAFSADGFDFKPFGPTPHASRPELQNSAVREDSQAFPEVAFVREAQRKDFWKSPLARTVLAVICLALALALMLQWAVRQKDALAAQAPRLAPWLQAMCRPLGCEVRPLRRIESLVIENSSFSRTGLDAYRLSFTFTNTGDADLEIPALEVTLTDSQDQAVVRRVVMPAEFGATATTLAAYSKLPGALTLKVAGGP
ncbi:MAG: DUF3426 domain-containing protein, partial [Macromonas bipunctata]|nr:DUF3426 domain-containing protein [Macromonas bipunctata]